jgi:phosphohistidine swiveling domain-containing protein
MASEDLAKLYKTQKSLTEWLEDIKHQDVVALRREDNEKRERLKIMHDTIGLPYNEPVVFSGLDLQKRTKKFESYLSSHGEELCALRATPTEDELPKLRMRGKTTTGAYEWFLQQDINPAEYRAEFTAHPAVSTWGTIFIVNKNGIQGEIIAGGHHQLTQGFYEGTQPMVFRYDFHRWMISPRNDDALAYLQHTIDLLKVPDKEKQTLLLEKLGTTFVHDYIEGYFETTDSPMGNWYNDYSRALGDLYADVLIKADPPRSSAKITGRIGCTGKATGPVCIVQLENMGIHFPEGAVLVCKVTTPDYVPFMQQAAAIVTDQGGILSHAAIVARELKKPCIVSTGNATQVLHDGQMVRVDATQGVVTEV